MCKWFCGYPPITFYQLFPVFFPGPITIRIDILWAQLLIDFSIDHLETMHTCSTWSEDVHVVLGLLSLFNFLHFFFNLVFLVVTR